ncbi:MAG: 1-phosphofructokinase [Oscillospiraceae bacterium]|nr:1-phosphofructokinase [Oscillospiraceae bacterium]
MIYTVTFNPALDYVLKVDKFCEGITNRSNNEYIYPGGKGVNVSVVLSALGIESRCLGFVSGFTGEKIKELLHDCGCMTDFIDLNSGCSRINVKIQSTVESEINATGPEISAVALDSLIEKLRILKSGDTICLAGSVPKTVPSSIYESILKELSGKAVRSVVDASGELLLKVLKYKPFLIKPNIQELEEIFNASFESYSDVENYAQKLIQMGAQNVLVSMGADGAILTTSEGKIYRGIAPTGVLKNSVGAGDSMVAGFLAGYDLTKNYEQALKLSVASGSATAYADWLSSKEDIIELLDEPSIFGL